MADNSTLGAPGLLFPFVLHSIESGIIQEDVDNEGGFALWGKSGEPGKVYATKPEAVEQAKRVIEITPTLKSGETGAVGSKKVTVTIGTETFEITTTATDVVADVIDDLVAAINNASTGSDLFVATDDTTKLTLTAKEYGSAYNSYTVTAESEDANIVIGANAVVQKTAGADAEAAGFLLGLCQRTTICDGYSEGDAVNVVKKGRVWVRVSGAVVSGDSAYVIDATGIPSASSSSSTAISGGVFKSNAADGELAELEIG